MKTHWKKSFDSPYIGSWDLEENQKELTLTIKEAKSEMTKDLKENSIKNIIYFEESGYKAMIVNSGNSKTIRELSGSPYLEDWAGIKITLYVKEVKAFGELHDALRIRTKTVELPVLTEAHPKFAAVKKALLNKDYTISQMKTKYQISTDVEQKLK